MPGDFLQREWGAEDVLGEAFAAVGVVGGHGAFAAVHIEAAVLLGQEIGELGRADEFGLAQGVEETVAVWKRRRRRSRRLRKMPRRARGMVKTNGRWGTSWQTELAIQAEMWRTRR